MLSVRLLPTTKGLVTVARIGSWTMVCPSMTGFHGMSAWSPSQTRSRGANDPTTWWSRMAERWSRFRQPRSVAWVNGSAHAVATEKKLALVWASWTVW